MNEVPKFQYIIYPSAWRQDTDQYPLECCGADKGEAIRDLKRWPSCILVECKLLDGTRKIPLYDEGREIMRGRKT